MTLRLCVRRHYTIFPNNFLSLNIHNDITKCKCRTLYEHLNHATIQ
jgi:hypothetical protein